MKRVLTPKEKALLKVAEILIRLGKKAEDEKRAAEKATPKTEKRYGQW